MNIRRYYKSFLVVSALLSGLVIAGSSFTLALGTAAPGQIEQSTQGAGRDKVRMSMRNVDFYLTDDIVANIKSLDGELTPTGNSPPNFDDKSSFVISVDSAQVAMTLVSLSNDLNDWVFSSPDAPLKQLKVSADGNKVNLSGTLEGKAGVRFESQGTLLLAPDGMIRVHTTTIKSAHLPLKGLMDTFGFETSRLINTAHVKGVTIDKDDMVLDPEKALPPPALHGHLTSVALRGQEILLTFGPRKKAAGEESATGGSQANATTTVKTPAGTLAIRNTCGGKNYIALLGGTIQFGKLSMRDADVQIIDKDSSGPFDFSMDQYRRQLEAGYSKISPSFGLCAFVPDARNIGTPQKDSKTRDKKKGAAAAASAGGGSPSEKH